MTFLIGFVLGVFLGGGCGFLLAALLAGAARGDAQRPTPGLGRHLPDSSRSSRPGPGSSKGGDGAV